jgi:hypothetical protein
MAIEEVSFSLIGATNSTLAIKFHGLTCVPHSIEYAEYSPISLVRYAWHDVDITQLLSDNTIIISGLRSSTQYRIRCITTHMGVYMSQLMTTTPTVTESDIVDISTYRRALEKIALLERENQRLKQERDDHSIIISGLEGELEIKNNEMYDLRQQLSSQNETISYLESRSDEFRSKLSLSQINYTALSKRSADCIKMWKSRFYNLKNSITKK